MSITSIPFSFEDELDLQKISKLYFNLDYDKTIRTVEFEDEAFNNALNYGNNIMFFDRSYLYRGLED